MPAITIGFDHARKFFLAVFFSLPMLAQAEDAYESNNTQQDATLLVVGNPTPQQHTLDPDQDVDWFRFNAQFFEIYDVKTVDVGSSVDLVLEFYDESGEQIGESVDDFTQGVGEEVSFRAPATGTFYIKVYDYYCINGGDGCAAPRGDDAKYSILIYIPVGAAGGADLSIEHSFTGEPVVGTPFPLGITVKNNGGQQEDDTADNLLILTYSEPQLPAPTTLPEFCIAEKGLVTCEKDKLEADVTLSYELAFEFPKAQSVRFTSTVAAFENTNYNLQQPDDVYSNNVVEDKLTASEGGGGGGGNDTDSDGDGINDDVDNCPKIANEDQKDFDEDGQGDVCDEDDDNDNYPDNEDAFPFDPKEHADADGDNIGDNEDDDDDNDGVKDSEDAYPLIPLGDRTDTDGDGAPDECDENCQSTGMAADEDDDGDGIKDSDDAYPLAAIGDLTDTDGDGAPDDCDVGCQNLGMASDDDDDNDGVPDSNDGFPLISLDGRKDTDQDGYPNDCDAACLETDLIADADDDNDNVIDEEDAFPEDPAASKDWDQDGRPDDWNSGYSAEASPSSPPLQLDDDDDGDGVLAPMTQVTPIPTTIMTARLRWKSSKRIPTLRCQGLGCNGSPLTHQRH